MRSSEKNRFSHTINLYSSQQTYYCCQQQSKNNVLDCMSTHVKPTTFPVHFGSGEKGRQKSILCTSYNSWFLLLKEHPIHIPCWVFHPLCTAANLCPTRLEVIQLTKTFQSGRVFLGVALLTGLMRRVGSIYSICLSVWSGLSVCLSHNTFTWA